ncbi:MAG: permease-like cell division protein FtsX [Patescibacteria group bacterium]
MLITTKRMIKGGFVSFWRNGFLSFSSIVVLTLSLLVIGGLIFLTGMASAYLNEVRSQVDVNVYFALNAPEEEILALQKTLGTLPEVATVEYVSREKALEQFKEEHKNDTLILQGLEEVGENPLPASFNIKAKDPSRYESVIKFLQGPQALSKSGSALVEKVSDNKKLLIIDRLSLILKTIERVGIGIVIVLVGVAIIVTLNTVRLVMYTRRDEISVMKLVGASNFQIRGPFVISGAMCGVISGIISLIVMYPIAYYATRVTDNFSKDFTLMQFYIANFSEIFIVILAAGVILGGVSSYLAVRRYLKI